MGVETLGDPDGYPILWCHGGLSSRLDAAAVDEAAKSLGVAILSIDRPGIGTSPRQGDLTVADWASGAIDHMTSLGYERFSVAGWSAGGPYALACAAVGPQRVERVATISSMHPLFDDSYRRELGLRVDRILFLWAADRPALARTLIRLGSRIPARMIMSDVMKSAIDAERQILRDRSSTILAFIKESTRFGVHGVIDDYARLADDWAFDFSSIAAEVTVWHGSADPLVPVSHGRGLTELVPHARFEELSARGHYLPFTDGKQIISSLMPC